MQLFFDTLSVVGGIFTALLAVFLAAILFLRLISYFIPKTTEVTPSESSAKVEFDADSEFDSEPVDLFPESLPVNLQLSSGKTLEQVSMVGTSSPFQGLMGEMLIFENDHGAHYFVNPDDITMIVIPNNVAMPFPEIATAKKRNKR